MIAAPRLTFQHIEAIAVLDRSGEH